MRMKSALRGRSTSAAEVSNISKHGFWVCVAGHEHFLPFADFPWFEGAPIGKILNMRFLHSDPLYWPDLDIDLSLESVAHPERFPLVSSSRTSAKRRPAVTGRGRRRAVLGRPG
jgi:hypothetical protein